MGGYFLGIDTSNYTTSIAVMDENRNLLVDNRKMLHVKEGGRGLRQSDALFQHVMNMPSLFQEISVDHIKAIGVSSRPRPVESSYMPVFRAGQSFAQTLAHVLKCEYKEYSHQEGHIKAAEWSLKAQTLDSFIAVHMSGGTTEILKIKKKASYRYEIQIIGGTSDISAGQFIDRVGVNLGFDFPAGKYMDQMAINEESKDLELPVAIKGKYFSFSGPETMAQRYIEKNCPKGLLAKAVLDCVSTSLSKSIKNCCLENGIYKVLFMGGVAASQYIRYNIKNALEPQSIEVSFADAKYCGDNAVGIAALALESWYCLKS